MKIAVVGLGYVGLSISILLAQYNQVCSVDISEEKVELINKRKSTIKDELIEDYLCNKKLDLSATLDYASAFCDAEYIVIATPTDYDEQKKFFNTSSVENVVENVLKINKNATIVIKSTVPIGFTENLIEKYNYSNILYCPEFLRETKALYDNLYPTRIIIGCSMKCNMLKEKAEEFSCLLGKCALKEGVSKLITGTTEAEAIKLFSNTYLALRISYFNELDSYAEINGLDAKAIIEGMGFDPRIGMYYNNPSFGYGGYCLPKDSKQLLVNFDNVPEKLIGAVVDSNEIRKDFIATQVIKKTRQLTNGKSRKPLIGIFRLIMKSGSDNFRQSSIQGIIERILNNNIEVIIYEPMLEENNMFMGCKVVNDLNQFKSRTDCIVANRLDTCLNDVREKVYTRDLYHKD